MNCSWLALAALPASLYSQNSQGSLAPIGVTDKLLIHAQWTVWPDSLLLSAAYAGWRQWRNDPAEWGQGAAGYGRRFASNLGYSAVRNAVGFALDSSLREDPRYFRSKRTGLWPRTRDVYKQTFIGRTDSGRSTFAFWRFGSAYSAGFISNAWEPKSVNSVGDALVIGTLRIAGDTAANWFREFWPDIKRKLRRN